MQSTLFDYMDVSKELRILTRIRLLAKQRFGDRFVVDEIIICKRCGKHGILYGYDPCNGSIILGIYINNEHVYITDEALEFHDDLCDYCYREEMEKVLDKVVKKVYEVTQYQNDIYILPHEAYWYSGKYIIELPGKKLKFKNRGQIEEKILGILRDFICKEFDSGDPEDLINKVCSKIKCGEWLFLELFTLIKLRHMRKSTKRVNNFEDLLSLVAYIERTSIENLRIQYRDYGMILACNRTIGFAPKEILEPTSFKDIVPSRKKDVLVYGDITWRIPLNLLKFFNIVSFAKNKDNILKIKTRQFIVYIVPEVV